MEILQDREKKNRTVIGLLIFLMKKFVSFISSPLPLMDAVSTIRNVRKNPGYTELNNRNVSAFYRS